jgi:ubiquinone/menaquinone biosynthesis C-methylase UbiE
MKLRTLRWHWNTMGQQDAMQAILTTDRTTRWNRDAFFQSGRDDILALITDADRLVPRLPRGRALDFGCGIGRLTSALAAHFDDVLGLDIADSMVEAARAQHANLQGCRFEVNLRSDLQHLPEGHFDFVLAWIVLQHMQPALMKQYIAEFIRVLSPGGLLVFQVPAEVEDPRQLFYDAPVVGGRLKQNLPRGVVRAWRWLQFEIYRRFVPHMEMYALTRDEVVDLVTRHGGRMLEVRSNQSHGPATPGFSYWVTKDVTRG